MISVAPPGTCDVAAVACSVLLVDVEWVEGCVGFGVLVDVDTWVAFAGEAVVVTLSVTGKEGVIEMAEAPVSDVAVVMGGIGVTPLNAQATTGIITARIRHSLATHPGINGVDDTVLTYVGIGPDEIGLSIDNLLSASQDFVRNLYRQGDRSRNYCRSLWHLVRKQNFPNFLAKIDEANRLYRK
ncbi:MAG: hypothetical protein JXB07_18490 [Anaerolineae bacterium]|nr:hypothetical protein [Anaerolineae bacterium]